jgi:hypothetical protein
MVRRGTVRCGVAQLGAVYFSKALRVSVEVGVTQEGAAWHSKVRRGTR